MAVRLPAWFQAGTYSAELDRQVPSALLMSSGTANVQKNGGIKPAAPTANLAVRQTTTASMQITVDPGVAWVPGTYTAQQGVYTVTNDSLATLTITTANSTNPRIDLVVLEVLDAVYSGSTNVAQLRVVAGTPSASPVVPNTPPSCIILARVAVAANATSITTANISDYRYISTAVGGINPISGGELQLLEVSGSAVGSRNAGRLGAYFGQYRDHPAIGLQRWNGSDWKSVHGGHFSVKADATQINPGGVYGFTAATGPGNAGMSANYAYAIMQVQVRFLASSQQTCQYTSQQLTNAALGENTFEYTDRIPGASGGGEEIYTMTRIVEIKPTSTADWVLDMRIVIGTGGSSVVITNPRAVVFSGVPFGL